MKLPHAEQPIAPEEKFTTYLLDETLHVWFVRRGETAPRPVTAYPLEDEDDTRT